jgi:hypothetical protein
MLILKSKPNLFLRDRCPECSTNKKITTASLSRDDVVIIEKV